MVYFQAPYYAKSYFKGPTKRLAKRLPVAKKTKRYVNRAISRRMETKEYITETLGSAISYDGPLIQDLSAVPEGTDINSREGCNLSVKSLQIKWRFPPFVIPTAGKYSILLRLMVIQWFDDTIASIPTLAEIFGSAIDASTIDRFPLRSITQSANMKVLYDRRFLLPEDSATAQPDQLFGSIYIPWKKIPRKTIKQQATATSGVNHLYFIAFSNQTNASTDDPLINFVSKMKYKG